MKRADLWWASLVAQMVKNLPAMPETWVLSQGWEDPLKKGMATHSSILAWRIPWTEEPGRLQSMGSQRVRHAWTTFIHVTSLHDGKEHQEENIHHCGKEDSGFLRDVSCECGVCSQWREMTHSPLCCSAPFAPPLPGPLTKGCCCPFSWLPSSLPCAVNQSQIWASNQETAPYRPSRSEETKFLTRNPVPSLCIYMKSAWHAHRRRSHLYPDALGMIPPEWVSSPCSLSHSGKSIWGQWWLGIGMGQELASSKCHVTADIEKGPMWVSAGISGDRVNTNGTDFV